MTASSPILLEMREKYERNKSSLTDVYRKREKYDDNENKNMNACIKKESLAERSGSNSNQQNTQMTQEAEFSEKGRSLEGGKEWIEKLSNDVENLNKDQMQISSKSENKKKKNHSSSLSKDYTSIYQI
jgi:hypothetical protein